MKLVVYIQRDDGQSTKHSRDGPEHNGRSTPVWVLSQIIPGATSSVKALVLKKPGEASVEIVPDPVAAPGELLLRVRMVGFCGSDLGAEYPRVDSAGRAQIRVKAPDATKVKLNFWSGPKVDMEKQSDGYWMVTTLPLVPGLHYYTVIIDGAEVSDLGSQAFFGGSKYASAIEVPEPGSTYYSAQDVPHGQVREVWYSSKVTGTWRHALIYAPPNYDSQTNVRYPVL